MKRRIEQLLNGKFEYAPPRLVVRPEEIEVRIEEGENPTGSFSLESEDGRKIRGFLYSSNPRMAVEPVEFQGLHNEIRYQADGRGFPDGTEEKGFFTICSDLGEYTVPFVLRSEKKAEKEKEQLAARDASELAALARQDFQKAYRCFISEGFRSAVRESQTELTGLYDSLSVPSFTWQSLEEFLVGAGQKETVQISVERRELSLSEVSESIAETVQIQKSTWGFQKITIESDAMFLRPEKKVLTTDEFAGSTYDLKLVVDVNLMHAGKNFGRVILSTPYQKVYIEVSASRAEKVKKARQSHICKIMRKKLEGLYVSFRLRKMDLSTWVERSVNVIGSYRRSGGEDPFAELFLIQLYFADGKRQKAIRILESVEARKERLNTPERYGFYLYLTTFFYQDASYVDDVERHIRELFGKNRTSWVLQWILLYLQESLLNDENAKYEAVAEQFRYGCRSRIMYLEAFQILLENPFLMRHLGTFELQLLRFAAKEQVLTAPLLRQAATLAAHYGKYSGLLLKILTDGYALHPSEELVRAVCLLLMRGDRRDPEAFFWYQKGVECGLRITGLYEYYMESLESPELMSMPQIIRMYFAYDTALDYRKRAAVYSRIVEKKEEDLQTYRTYRAAMEKFTLDQLEMGRYTEDLAVLYHSFLRKGSLTRTMAENLMRLLFSWEITCTAPQIRSVTVHSTRLLQEQSAVFLEGKARIAIYDPDSVLTLEDTEGTRFAAEPLCEKHRLLESDEMLKWCAELVPSHPGFLLFAGVCCLKTDEISEKTLPYLRSGCDREEFQDSFRSELRGAVLRYYVRHPADETLSEFLEGIPYLDYVKVDKSALITLLAEEGMCTDAFSLLDIYGAEGIPLLQLVRICSRMVIDLEFGENPMLLALCHYCFESGKYDDRLLRYLLLYYEGSIRQMMQIWKAARGFDLDTLLLEEKIMMMILFTGSGTQGSEPVFESYAKKMGRKRLRRAYLNLKAYEYFVRGLPVYDIVFRYIEKDYVYLLRRDRLQEQEEVCRLALLQYYARQAELTEEQRGLAEGLLEEFGAKGMRFAFWKRFDRELLCPYQMDGRVFVEYVGNPKSTVTIRYRLQDGEDYVTETMKNCFEGIFVKEFTLFYGDRLECILEEELDGKKTKADQRILTAPDAVTDGGTQYEMLNRISKALLEKDEETLSRELDSYLLLERLTGELFPLI